MTRKKENLDGVAFFWNVIRDRNLENVLLNYDDVAKVTVCSAYLSWYGVDLLKQVAEKNELSQDNLQVYVWRDFSQSQPGEILESLQSFAQVKIFQPDFSDGIFHPKLYVLHTHSGERRIIIGSSNLTQV